MLLQIPFSCINILVFVNHTLPFCLQSPSFSEMGSQGFCVFDEMKKVVYPVSDGNDGGIDSLFIRSEMQTHVSMFKMIELREGVIHTLLYKY